MTDKRSWKIGMSIHPLSEEALYRWAEAGIEAIEYYTECDRNAYGEVPRWAKNAGIEVWSRHLPFIHKNFTYPDPERNRSSMQTLLQSIDEAAQSGVKVIVVHPSNEPIPEDKRGEYMARCVEGMGTLLERCRSYGLTLAAENLPRTCLLRDSDEVLYLMGQLPGLKLCVDTNHLLKEPHRDFIRRVAPYLVTTHVSDYDFTDEKHWMPMEGKIDWKELLNELEKADYHGPLIYETGVPEGLTPRDIYENRQRLNTL